MKAESFSLAAPLALVVVGAAWWVLMKKKKEGTGKEKKKTTKKKGGPAFNVENITKRGSSVNSSTRERDERVT